MKHIGKLRERATIEALTTSSDGAGGTTGSWLVASSIGTSGVIWANIEPMSGIRREHYTQVYNGIPHIITIRYYSALNINNIQGYRIIMSDTSVLRLTSIINSDYRDDFMILSAEKGLPSSTVGVTFSATVIDTDNSSHTLSHGESFTCSPTASLPATAQNSDATFSTTIPAGTTQTLPDIDIVNPLGVSSTYPSVKDYTSPTFSVIVKTSTAAQLNTALSALTTGDTEYASKIKYRRVPISGQFTSLANWDDAYVTYSTSLRNYTKQGVTPILQGEDSSVRNQTINDIIMLSPKTPNAFGTLDVYTKLDGTTAIGSTGDIAIINHLNGMVYARERRTANLSWTAAMAESITLTIDGLTGWRMCSQNELEAIINDGGAPLGINIFKSFGAGISSLWTSNTDMVVSTVNARVYLDTEDITRVAKSGTATTRAYMVCKEYYT